MKHSVYALQYRLVSGPVDLAPLRILALRQNRWRDWNVECCILGASHAVRLRRDGNELTEILTCGGAPGGRIRLHAPLSEGAAALCWAGLGLVCRIEARMVDAEAAACLLLDRAPPHRLEFAFPLGRSGGGPSGMAATRLAWQDLDSSFTVESVHFYPEERLAAYSRSEFTSGEAAR